jgi:hypothetical protein
METTQIASFLILVTVTISLTGFLSTRRWNPGFVRVNGNGRKFLVIAFVALTGNVFGQNYTSTTSGAWTTGANWGGSAPATSGQNWGTVNVNHNMTISGNYDFRARLDIASGKTMQVNGNFSISNGATINVYGTLQITGNASLNADMQIYPGGKVVVDGNLTILNSPYLKVGTNVAPGNYADLVVKQNLVSQNSGDIILERNARVAIFKNFTSNSSGGTLMNIKSGAQIYIDGNIALTGGGDVISNGNGTTPIGFYVNGTSTTTGGGSSISTNRGTKATMFTNDKPFYDWVNLQNGALPITLMYFKVDKMEAEGVALVWATATEENFNMFIVERSMDGLTYLPIAEVQGAGTSNEIKNYAYTDYTAVIGDNYYRLKSVDFDDTFEYSKVVYVPYEGNKSMSIYPNPSAGASVSFSINFNPQDNDKIVILDFFGSEVTTASVSQVNGEIVFNSHLERGTYILKYVSSHFQKVERLIVR